MDTTIESISALEILDSRGNPTVEVEVSLAGRLMGTRGCSLRRIHRRA